MLLKSLCKSFTCPRKNDTATERRKNLTSKQMYWMKHKHKLLFTNLTSIKITCKYVELPNGELIFTKLFEPKDSSTVKGMVCYSIGFGNHIEWNQQHGIKYAELGFITFMWEPKGHGRSDGYHTIIEDFHRDIVDVAIWIFNWAINQYIKKNVIYKENIDKDKKYFLAGESMGGGISILAALKLQKQIDNPFQGIIVGAPMVRLAPNSVPPKWQIWLLENLLMPLCPYAKLIPNATKNQSLTTDMELEAMLNDNPVVYDANLSIITAYNIYYTSLEIDKRASELKLPMLIMHGMDDNVMDCQGSKKFFENCGCDPMDKELKIYENVGHFIFDEEPKIFSDTAEWMIKRINIKRSQTGQQQPVHVKER